MSENMKIFDLDLERCVGCQACAVACMDQNEDLFDENGTNKRQVFILESDKCGIEKISYISLACMHCEDPSCVMACPTGAITKNVQTGLIQVDQALCIGCHSCSMACPNGAPTFDHLGKMTKCNGCIERVQSGLEPACVRACPTHALKFDTKKNLEKNKKANLMRKIINA